MKSKNYNMLRAQKRRLLIQQTAKGKRLGARGVHIQQANHNPICKAYFGLNLGVFIGGLKPFLQLGKGEGEHIAGAHLPTGFRAVKAQDSIA